MSLPGVHIGFAAAITTLVVAGMGLPARVRWPAIALSALWAVIPDLYWLAPGIRPWYKPLLHDSALANLFWLHGVIDRLDPRDRRLYATGALTAFLVVFLATELWLQRPEPVEVRE